MKPKHVRLFIKPGCPWCDEAIEWLNARKIQYETLDVIRDAAARAEMAALRARGATAPGCASEALALATPLP
jgi:glutaredoxin